MHTSPILLNVLVFLLIAITSGASGPPRDHLLFTGDFESGELAGWGRERCCDDSINVVDAPARAGGHAARFEVRKDQPDVAGSKRAELKLDAVPPTSERWYGFSIYLPDDYENDPTPEIVAQWHAVPDFDEGEDWRSPPLALMTEAGRWKLDCRSDARRVMPGNRAQDSTVRDLGGYDRGRWTDWVMHVKWSWQDDGLLEVWKDGEPVIREQGPNAYNDEHGTYFKIGIYKWRYKQTPDEATTDKRVLFIDEVRMGDAEAGYEDVAPAQERADRSTAASVFDWGEPIATDDFDGETLGKQWGVYDSVGHAGNGIRSPKQATVGDGRLTITGTPTGTTAGMAWQPGRQYGRWEVRMKAPAGCGCYHPVLILWPDANDFPVGGEVDFAEVVAADRQRVNFFLHFDADNKQVHEARKLDVTQWHNYAVEWTPDHVTGYIDGEKWFTASDKEKLPPRPMHLTIQLDWFPRDRDPGHDVSDGGSMQVDWVRIYK